MEALSRSALFTISRCDKLSPRIVPKASDRIIETLHAKIFIRVTGFPWDGAPAC
jgi:hypothetical protein